MIADQRHEGGLIVADRNAVSLVTPAGAVLLLAGVPGESGNNDQDGQRPEAEAEFGEITDLFQISLNVIVVVDKKHNCVRQIDRDSRHVTAFAGNCYDMNDQQFKSRSYVSAKQARLYQPLIGALQSETALYYTLTQDEFTLVKHDLSSGMHS